MSGSWMSDGSGWIVRMAFGIGLLCCDVMLDVTITFVHQSILCNKWKLIVALVHLISVVIYATESSCLLPCEVYFEVT
jgi:hypothetical protein